jgi:hypothetical protein
VASFQDGVAAGKEFCMLYFEVSSEKRGQLLLLTVYVVPV